MPSRLRTTEQIASCPLPTPKSGKPLWASKPRSVDPDEILKQTRFADTCFAPNDDCLAGTTRPAYLYGATELHELAAPPNKPDTPSRLVCAPQRFDAPNRHRRIDALYYDFTERITVDPAADGTT
jgi:hypothetical protein